MRLGDIVVTLAMLLRLFYTVAYMILCFLLHFCCKKIVTLQTGTGLKQAQHEVRLLEKMLSELREAGDAAVSAFLTMPPTSPYYLSKKDKERKSKKSSKKASKSVSVVSTNDIGVHFPVNATGSTPNFLGLDKFQVGFYLLRLKRWDNYKIVT